jgi:hypothetical protein
VPRRFLVPIDLNNLELQNALIQVLGTDPSSPPDGRIWVNSTDSTLVVRHRHARND